MRRVPDRGGCRLVLVVALLLLTPAASHAEPEPFHDQVSVPYVLVPLVVRGPKGVITDLERNDVRLYVDGRRTVLDSFEHDPNGPARVLFLVDLSGSMAGRRLETATVLIQCLLERHRPGDLWALASFSNRQLGVEVEATADADALRERMALWEPYGETAIHDAVFWVPDLTPLSTPMRQAVILITDGTDNASTISASTARERLTETEIPVYVAALDTVPATGSDERGYRYADVLELLANGTGGQYHRVGSGEDARATCDEINRDLRRQYILGFPTLAHGEARPRTIRIQLRTRKSRDLAYRRRYTGTAPR